jgi:mannose-1-phosphate guanylyltransferase
VNLYAVILCGGRGERFWPKSRRSRPKQFIPLFGTHTLTQQTSARIRPLCPTTRQLFVASPEFSGTLREQLGARAGLLHEPVGRNTAPAIAIAAAYLQHLDPKSAMVVLPADHMIEDQSGFIRSVRLAARLAEQGLLVTFGIPPTRPDTGYGYVQLGSRIAGRGKLTAHQVLAFKEKPARAVALRYVKAGSYVWNSGMFVWRTATILEAFAEHLPDFHARLVGYSRALGTRRASTVLRALYRDTEPVSIDYAVMEKARNVACVRAPFDWDDVGSWLALERHLPGDLRDNVASGSLVELDTSDCVVDTDSGIVATLGIKNLVIVRAADAVLVADRDHLDNLKKLLAKLAGVPGGQRYL